jgi:tetratricopeptide (TPR) repeat protein
VKLAPCLVIAATCGALVYDPSALAAQPKTVALLVLAALFSVLAVAWRVKVALSAPLALFGAFALWSFIRGEVPLSAACLASLVIAALAQGLGPAERRRVVLLSCAGVGVGAAVITLVAWARGGRGMALHGGMGNPNALGLLLAVTLVPSTVAALAAARIRSRACWWWLAALGLQGAAWILAESRAAWLALPVGLSIAWLSTRCRVGRALSIGRALCVGLALASIAGAYWGGPIASGGANGAIGALAGRFWIWKHSLGVALRSLPWGSGGGRFSDEFLVEQGRALQALDLVEASRKFVHAESAHSEWLQALAASGPVGLLLLAAFVAVGIDRLSPRFAAGAGALAALAVGASADVPLHAPAVALLTALLLATAPRLRWPVGSSWVHRAAALGALALCAFALTHESRQWRSTRWLTEARDADLSRRAHLLARAAALAPRSAEAQFALGMDQVERGEITAGLERLQIARAISRTVSSEVAIGNALSELGRWPEARARFESALLLNPGSFRARANLAATLGTLGEPDLAVAELARARRLFPGHPKLALIAEAIERQRRDRETR